MNRLTINLDIAVQIYIFPLSASKWNKASKCSIFLSNQVTNGVLYQGIKSGAAAWKGLANREKGCKLYSIESRKVLTALVKFEGLASYNKQ